MQHKPRSLPRVQRIHNPVLKGKALLLLPEGLLVRWPERVPMPAVGDEFSGTAVRVPPDLQKTAEALLFDPRHLARCDAAKRLSDRKDGRRSLLRIFGRSYVQKMLAAATRIQPELREQIEAQSEGTTQGVSLRKLFRAAYAPTLARQIRRAKL